ncbi:uncharacterized protein At2g33490-like isoform X1 [Silene latifolia]|uniref:uncharacterized protein At2g33490-like isoform X1 n=2 Tax=Silene latifolia TaxID=37657 RepID=UPI003D77DD72
MKSSIGMLKKFSFLKNDAAKDRREFNRPPKIDELALASQEMQKMRDCYDSLLSAAAATANSAYEFSESLHEMGGCLLDKAELYKDEDSKKALLMLGNIQLELQKLVDLYRSHIFVTITNPSESLLNQLQTVQEMKQQCDEKRTVYEYMLAQQREKGRSKGGKGESFSMDQLKQAHTEYEEEATLCVFRLKSLKQGQSRCLLTQAARHHTAQLNFFKRGVKSLETIDPHVKLIAEKQHIDYQLSGLDDNDGEDEEENSYDSKDQGELSFDYRPQKLGTDAGMTSRNSMELDQEEESVPKPSTMENTEFRFEKVQADSQMLDSEPRTSNYSHSAPILAEKKIDPAERIRRMRPSLTQKFHTYVLPTPGDAKPSSSTRTSSAPRSRPKSLSDQNIWHSSPIETKMNKRDSKEDNQSVGNSIQASTRLPPLADGLPSRPSDAVDSSDHKKIKRQAFSGPLSSNPRSTKSSVSAFGPISGPISQPLIPRPSSPKASYRSPPSISPPKISELHELPRPPGNVINKPGSSGFTAPFPSRNSESAVKNRTTSTASNTASPLPIPPVTFPRSLSTPSSHYRNKALSITKVFESSQPDKDAASPPLTPMSLSNANAVLASPRAGT